MRGFTDICFDTRALLGDTVDRFDIDRTTVSGQTGRLGQVGSSVGLESRFEALEPCCEVTHVLDCPLENLTLARAQSPRSPLA